MLPRQRYTYMTGKKVLRMVYTTSMSGMRNDRRIRKKKTAYRQKSKNECYLVTQMCLRAFD